MFDDWMRSISPGFFQQMFALSVYYLVQFSRTNPDRVVRRSFVIGIFKCICCRLNVHSTPIDHGHLIHATNVCDRQLAAMHFNAP
jgi:hypothetical protein